MSIGTHCLVSKNACRDSIACCDGAGVGLCTETDKVEEVCNDSGVTAAMTAGCRFQMIDQIRFRTFAALCPDMDVAMVIIADIFDSSLCTISEPRVRVFRVV